jgi:transposase InsO family protein
MSDLFWLTIADRVLRSNVPRRDTHKVLTWRLSNTLDASFCVEALEEAIARYGKPEIMNTDQGSQ